MSFPSQYAPLIWDELYEVQIPDNLTLDPQYVKVFGTYVTGNKQYDEMIMTNFTTVKIPIIRILEYYLEGIEVRIPRREDMIRMHKNIELYLEEWRQYLTYTINSDRDLEENKKLILGLERLSKVIYEKANARELIDQLFLSRKVNFGLKNPFKEIEEEKEVEKTPKPNYEGISTLIKKRGSKGGSRF